MMERAHECIHSFARMAFDQQTCYALHTLAPSANARLIDTGRYCLVIMRRRHNDRAAIWFRRSRLHIAERLRCRVSLGLQQRMLEVWAKVESHAGRRGGLWLCKERGCSIVCAFQQPLKCDSLHIVRSH